MSRALINKVIPAEAVEAAAKNLYCADGLNLWDKEDESTRAHYLRKSTAALEAAAPFIRAEALEEAAAVLVEQGNPRPPCPDSEECCGGPSSCGKNQQTTVVASPTWLRARAAALRGQG